MEKDMIDDRIKVLTDEQAVSILRCIARKWIEQPNVEAFIVYQRVENFAKERNLVFPQWLKGDPKYPSPELALTSRIALSVILENEEDRACRWVEDELANLEEAKAHALDPITLAILGATLVGCILAARVQKIGSVTFYEGVPEELGDVIKSASGVISGHLN